MQELNKRIILEVKNLKKYYPLRRGLFYKIVGWIKAVDGVSFAIREGETLAVVGESGCGKTTLAKTILRLIEPQEGNIYFFGKELINLPPQKMRPIRRHLQIIFQDPFNSLDSRFRVIDIIQEGLANFMPAKEKRKMHALTEKILREVELPLNSLYRYPHEFSGGQRQRISLARSLILNPKLLVLDEPVSSLDVSIQAQIINLLLELQQKLNLSYLFIAHDLNVIKLVSDEVCVMYLGKVVERAETKELFSNPLHPYTKLLLSCLISLEEKKERKKIKLAIEPSFLADSRGCNFFPRCRVRGESCKNNQPTLKEVSKAHWLSCFYINRGDAQQI